MIGMAGFLLELHMTIKRTFTFLEVKKVEESAEFVTISGIATTGRVDRVYDVVEPLGATFAEEIPLLWQHMSDKPVGIARLGKPTKSGIPFTAKLPRVKEPGLLKDRVDEAIQSLRYRLVGAVSIGFRVLNDAIERMKEGGLRFLETEIMELSICSIPANPDAVITGIKSLDTALRAASGTKQPVFINKTGVSVPRKSTRAEEAKHMNLQEQIASFEAKRAASAARMETIMSKSADEGRTLDAEETEQYDEAADEVKAVDSHLTRLKGMETLAVAKAKSVTVDAGRTQEAAGASRSPHIIQIDRKLDKGIAFARYVGCMAAGQGSVSDALAFAKGHFANDALLHKTIEVAGRFRGEQLVQATKTAVDIGTTTDSDFAAPLVNYSVMTNDFIEYLRPQTIIGRIPNLRKVPFNIRVPRQTGGGTAQWVGEGAPKPLTRQSFDYVSLAYMKLAVITVITQELARFSQPNAEMLIRDDLAKAVIAQMDQDFIDPDNAGTANVKPASITNGVTMLASAGNGENAVREDVRTMFSSWITNNLNPSGGVWIMPTSTALSLSLMVNALGQPSFPGITMNGGTFFGLPVVTSENAGVTDSSGNGHIVALVNAPEILLADDGQVTIDVSREASVQMDDAPTNPPVAATVLQSFWQQNLIGIKAERFITWAKARSTSVVLTGSVNWGEDLT